MANRVKGYYQAQHYEDQVIHVVTRLDRDTSGLMLLQNMGLPMRSWITVAKEAGRKKYQALVAGELSHFLPMVR